MKKTNLLLATALLSGSILSTSSVVNAASAADPSKDGIEVKDETSASATTTAEFSVEAGKLSFDSAPDFNFGQKSILDILKGEWQQKNNLITDEHNDSHTTVNEDGDKLDAISIGILQISDYRGAGSSWQLAASITDFTNKDGKGSVKGVISVPGLNHGAAISNTSSVVWDSSNAKTNGQGVANADLSSGATLSLSDSQDIQAGKYNATINWSLQNTTKVAVQG
ncbi:cell surface protein [Companilactobacillus sp. RD055328]|uniref:WxL domain-containing protein n=1 Tax=Companilactobacillus sp. RD055328 TaxID=2916634 RepID=UPI001FC85E24|nr:WxL domain-containing protein [Companilactobacillus sp. RD055328]GKQ42204.1 cell surface protein [Companilactobacillus sp. RD055328]